MVDAAEASDRSRHRDFRLVRTQRALQIVLGLFWLLDAGLQFQPYMFSSNFTTTYLLNNAQNQPDVIRWIITNVGNFVGPHVAVWNTFFALIQVAIGLGLLVRQTVRPALVVSFLWAFGVWFFGEGLGLIFTGSASALTGAPGSVFLYGLIGLMAWPRSAPTEEGEMTEPRVGLASSAAGNGLGGAVTPLLVWCGYWSLAAILFLLPDNRTSTSVSSAITGMSSGEPSAYSHFLNSFGNSFGSSGVWTTWLLAIGSLVIGFGPLVFRRPTPFLAAGGLLATFFWVSGQGLGGIFTGSGTDPNYRSADRAPGAGHGAGRAAGPNVLAFAVLDRAFSISRVGAGEPGGPAGGALPHRRLPSGGPGVDQHGHGRHDWHVRGNVGFGRRDFDDRHLYSREQWGAEDGAGHPEHTEHGHGWAGHQHEHERGRRQRGGWTEHHEIELALHRSGIASGRGPGPAGPWRQRVRRHPHGGPRMLTGADVLPTDQFHPVRPSHQRGCGSLLHASGGTGCRVRTGQSDGLPDRLLRESNDRDGQSIL